MEETLLHRATFEFAQDANCLRDNIPETLIIECESSMGIDNDGDCFYVLKTESWSIDNLEELQKLFDRIKKVIKK